MYTLAIVHTVTRVAKYTHNVKHNQLVVQKMSAIGDDAVGADAWICAHVSLKRSNHVRGAYLRG